MRKKGAFVLPETFAFVVFVAIIIVFGIVIIVMQVLGLNITKELAVNIIYEPVSIQDSLLSLFEMKNENGITFNRALVYSIYENTLNPKIPQSGASCTNNICDYDLKAVSKKYFDYVYSGKEYKLFLYNPYTKEEKIIAREGNDNDFRLYPYGKRDSITIKPEDFWLVLYVK